MANPEDAERDTDTPTGTDPEGKYREPGYQEKSLGQAVSQDEELADELAEQTDDDREAEERFEEEAAGSPKLGDD